MKVNFETSRFYPCHPVFIVSLYDRHRRVKTATYSSSFSRGNSLVLVILKGTAFDTFLESDTDFSVNFLSPHYLPAIETGGMLYYKTDPLKTEKHQLTFDKCISIDAPSIDESMLVIECRREGLASESSGRCQIVTASIQARRCEDYLLQHGVFQYSLFNIPICEGDSTQLVYRFMDTTATLKCSYLPWPASFIVQSLVNRFP